MNIEITGRRIEIPSGIEEYAREKAEKVAKYLKRDVRVQVVLEREGDNYQVEMIVSGYRGPVIVSHVQHEEVRAAVDLAIDKIEQQLRKVRGRRKDHQGQSMAGEPPEGVEPSPVDTEEPEVSYEDVIDEELNK